MRRTLLVASHLVAAIVVHSTAFGAIIFSDQSSFDAALVQPSTLVDTYNDFSGNTFISAPLDRGSYLLTEISDITAITDGAGATVNGTSYLFLAIDPFNPAPEVSFDFNSPVIALGFDTRQLFGAQLMVTTANFSTSITPGGFFGVIFDSQVSTVNLRGFASGPSGAVSIDNIRTSPIPEPTSIVAWSLLGLTLAAGVGLKRRRTARL